MPLLLPRFLWPSLVYSSSRRDPWSTFSKLVLFCGGIQNKLRRLLPTVTTWQIQSMRQKCLIHSCLHPHACVVAKKDQLSSERLLSEYSTWLQLGSQVSLNEGAEIYVLLFASCSKLPPQASFELKVFHWHQAWPCLFTWQSKLPLVELCLN